MEQHLKEEAEAVVALYCLFVGWRGVLCLLETRQALPHPHRLASLFG